MCKNKFLIVGLGNPEKKLEYTRHNVGKYFVNRIAEEFGGTEWITKNSYGGSISVLNYTLKKEDIPVKNKNKNKKKGKNNEKKIKQSTNDSYDSNDSNGFSEITKNNIENQNLKENNNEQLNQNDVNINLNQDVKDKITFQLYFLKPKYYINESGKGVLKAVEKFNIPKENVIILHDNLDKKLGHIQLKEKGSANGHNGIRSTIECLGDDNFYRIKIGIDRPPKTEENKAIYYSLVGDYVLEPFKPNEFLTINNEIFNKVIEILRELAYKKAEEIFNQSDN